jgi:thiosulfate/3-mercaptopyruvate sulfurtransferase
MSFGPLITADELRTMLDEPELRIADVRWSLERGPARDDYIAGHIPGAVFVDLDHDLSQPTGPGRHPFPSPEHFARAMRRAGVSARTRVVAYDDVGGSVAARLWWLLRFYGHDDVAVLDAGLQAWEGPLQQSWVHVAEGDFRAATPPRAQVLDFDAVRTLSSDTVLLDARAPERYRGETEPIDPRAGHIPGAVSAFWKGNLGPDGRFLTTAELRKRFTGLGVRADSLPVAYCGSGVNACHDLLALELAGLRGRLYAGSWSDWSGRPEAPVELG